jgi:hypothetical protein
MRSSSASLALVAVSLRRDTSPVSRTAGSQGQGYG